MFFEELEQHLHVASKAEAITLTRIDRDFWNVISIHGSVESRVELPDASSVLHACFDDIEGTDSRSTNHAAAPEDLAEVFRFAESIGHGPLLIQCQLGLSRSPAVALAWVCKRLACRKDIADMAVDTLLRLRSKAQPNLHVLTLGLRQFLPKPEATALAQTLVDHPRLLANRLKRQ